MLYWLKSGQVRSRRSLADVANPGAIAKIQAIVHRTLQQCLSGYKEYSYQLEQLSTSK
ncbi:hypothetical protein [Anabaena azotica]|uniref:Uncharacterized protein n=1 Tax=Anabaena azotica FACHB-119 TaxID=947527 RepID=A0ABR8D1Q7_9NOST|nr:hypothetical protein [Anabaena azotica]MBD2501104.1 hypothetical protein [Anabaena azotica FACHB-119]